METHHAEGFTYQTVATALCDHKTQASSRSTCPSAYLPLPTGRGALTSPRANVGRRRSSVFVVFPLETFHAESYAAAVDMCHAATRPGISRQAYALGPKILEVAEVVAEDDRIREVHPEVSFAAMRGAPLGDSKKTWAGFHERMRPWLSSSRTCRRILPSPAERASTTSSMRRPLRGPQLALPKAPPHGCRKTRALLSHVSGIDCGANGGTGAAARAAEGCVSTLPFHAPVLGRATSSSLAGILSSITTGTWSLHKSQSSGLPSSNAVTLDNHRVGTKA